ncbi:CPC_1213 family protein [Clostridium oryzae]|uniref:Uncharacterized protein n=1 Tax=Clostridium oryzae TaxID=1450648 RepID=A0A1V4ISY5_9CLOT|nr:CPC_1213 family protein [Clostridium oryzae]OPJ62930.1 hypothetical protein CLORY_15540 [Clostridium oryzae]
MDEKNKMKVDNNNKKEDRKFKKKNIKHDPQAESARYAFEDKGHIHTDYI